MRHLPAYCSSRSARIVVLAALMPSPAGGVASADTGQGPVVLEFEARADGRCQILSEGGKLITMHNRHPERAVKYRLVRYFADHPQNRVDGEIAAAGAQPLGCDTVDGRPQRWVVERFKILGE